MDELTYFLQDETAYHPEGKKIFAAFRATPFNKVRVVIIGQDPYPKKCEATGLAFSMPKDKKRLSPSIKSIYRALKKDLKKDPPEHGNLDHWAEQGVFLLNRVLTLHRVGATHNRKEWRNFTQATVDALASSGRPIQFILWGAKAQAIELPNYPDCLIHKAPHPEPRTTDLITKFTKAKHFSKVNTILTAMGEKEIKWLP